MRIDGTGIEEEDGLEEVGGGIRGGSIVLE